MKSKPGLIFKSVKDLDISERALKLIKSLTRNEKWILTHLFQREKSENIYLARMESSSYIHWYYLFIRSGPLIELPPSVALWIINQGGYNITEFQLSKFNSEREELKKAILDPKVKSIARSYELILANKR